MQCPYVVDPAEENFSATARDVLSDAQLTALGLIAAEWGMLEAALYTNAAAICGLGARTLLTFTGNPGAKKLAEIIRAVLPTYVQEASARDKLDRLLKEVERLADLRNDAVHACWVVLPVAAGRWPLDARLTGSPLIVKNRGKSSRTFSLSESDMVTIANDVAATRHGLNEAVIELRGNL